MKSVLLLTVGLLGVASGLVMPAQALRVVGAPSQPTISMFAGSKKSAPKVAKKAIKKTAKKAASPAASFSPLEALKGLTGGAVVPTALGKGRLTGKDNLLTTSTREKTKDPSLNIENYQDWGPIGGVVEAINLLRGLAK